MILNNDVYCFVSAYFCLQFPVDFAAILGFHGMLNQVQYHKAFVSGDGEAEESGEEDSEDEDDEEEEGDGDGKKKKKVSGFQGKEGKRNGGGGGVI